MQNRESTKSSDNLESHISRTTSPYSFNISEYIYPKSQDLTNETVSEASLKICKTDIKCFSFLRKNKINSL